MIKVLSLSVVLLAGLGGCAADAATDERVASTEQGLLGGGWVCCAQGANSLCKGTGATVDEAWQNLTCKDPGIIDCFEVWDGVARLQE